MLFLQRKKEYYLFVQLQEHWFSYVNTCLILFVAQSTKSFILLFKKKSFCRAITRDFSALDSCCCPPRVAAH